KTSRRCIISNAKLATNRDASNSRMKLFDIDPIRIYDGSFGRHACFNKIASLDFSDDEDARCRGEIQSLRSFQQISKAQSPPMFRHPNFRPVVFKKQWPARTQAGFDSTPIESTVALIDEVGRRCFHLSASASGEEHSVAKIKSGARETERI